LIEYRDFDADMRAGSKGEAFACYRLGVLGFKTRAASKHENRVDRIDAWLEHGGCWFSVQVKTDNTFMKARKKGEKWSECFCVEMEDGIDEQGRATRPGWRFCCKADVFLYFVRGVGAWVVDVPKLPRTYESPRRLAHSQRNGKRWSTAVQWLDIDLAEAFDLIAPLSRASVLEAIERSGRATRPNRR
jgi:hypothetical protein